MEEKAKKKKKDGEVTSQVKSYYSTVLCSPEPCSRTEGFTVTSASPGATHIEKFVDAGGGGESNIKAPKSTS